MTEKEIETYAQRRAKEHAEREGDNGNAEISFREGFSAGRELGEVMGRQEYARMTARESEIIVKELEATLKALPGSGKVE